MSVKENEKKLTVKIKNIIYTTDYGYLHWVI